MQRNYSDRLPFSPCKKESEQHIPTGWSRKGGSWDLSSRSILIHAEQDREPAISYAWGATDKISSSFLSVSGFNEGGTLNLKRLLKYFLVMSQDLQRSPTRAKTFGYPYCQCNWKKSCPLESMSMVSAHTSEMQVLEPEVSPRDPTMFKAQAAAPDKQKPSREALLSLFPCTKTKQTREKKKEKKTWFFFLMKTFNPYFSFMVLGEKESIFSKQRHSHIVITFFFSCQNQVFWYKELGCYPAHLSLYHFVLLRDFLLTLLHFSVVTSILQSSEKILDLARKETKTKIGQLGEMPKQRWQSWEFCGIFLLMEKHFVLKPNFHYFSC